jgi:hypothetical protein
VISVATAGSYFSKTANSFNGMVKINGRIDLEKKDSLIIKNEDIKIETTDEDAELVLFITDENAKIFDGGMYSGNKS